MEDVLEVYKRPYDPKRPVVCLDETSKQLIGEVRTPVPIGPSQVAHYDYEYVPAQPAAGTLPVSLTPAPVRAALPPGTRRPPLSAPWPAGSPKRAANPR